MVTFARVLGMMVAGLVGCSSGTTSGGSNPNQGGGAGGSSTAAGGTAAGGTAASGAVRGPSGGCPEIYFDCRTTLTFPFASLPDGTLLSCAGQLCDSRAITNGQVAIDPAQPDRVKIVDSALVVSWQALGFGSVAPPGCYASSVTFQSPGGAVVALLPPEMLPTVVTSGSCGTSQVTTYVAPQPIDIAAQVRAQEDGAGGEGGAGTGGEAAGGSGGSP